MQDKLTIKSDGMGIAKFSGTDDKGMVWAQFVVDALAGQTTGNCASCHDETPEGWFCLEENEELCNQCVDFQPRKDNIFFKDHMEAFNHAIANDYLTDNENDSNYAGNYMYMNSEHIREQYHPESSIDIDWFKNRDTREYIKVYN